MYSSRPGVVKQVELINAARNASDNAVRAAKVAQPGEYVTENGVAIRSYFCEFAGVEYPVSTMMLELMEGGGGAKDAPIVMGITVSFNVMLKQDQINTILNAKAFTVKAYTKASSESKPELYFGISGTFTTGTVANNESTYTVMNFDGVPESGNLSVRNEEQAKANTTAQEQVTFGSLVGLAAK